MAEISNPFTDGAAYERVMGRWSRQIGRTFLDWLDPAHNLKWLDVGCGNGAFTEELIARCAPAEVEAIDPSEEQIAYARRQSAAGLARFQHGDAQALPFDDNVFDVAVMALVIAFVPDADQAIREMTRVVRPGGRVATYMWDLPGGGAPVNPIYEAMAAEGIEASRPPNSDVSRMANLTKLWVCAGLEDVQSRVFELAVSYRNFDEFWETYTLPVGPQGQAVATLSPAAKDGLRRRLAHTLPIATDGGVAFRAFANGVMGRKPK